jgi:hypothetical protein
MGSVGRAMTIKREDAKGTKATKRFLREGLLHALAVVVFEIEGAGAWND